MNDHNGHLIELRISGSNWRDHLAYTCSDGEVQQRAVHAGDSLELWFENKWIAVRYESSRGQRGWLFINDEQSYPLERSTMRLRWPR